MEVLLDEAGFEDWTISPSVVDRLVLDITVAALLVLIVTMSEPAVVIGSLTEPCPAVDVETTVLVLALLQASVVGFRPDTVWDVELKDVETVALDARPVWSPTWVASDVEMDPDVLVSDELFPDSLPPINGETNPIMIESQ